MSKVASLGHVGIYVQDLPKMVDFYTGVLGLTVTDGGGLRPDGRPASVFMSAQPEAEQHEFVIGQADGRHSNAQQISFNVDSLDDLRELYHAIRDHGECTEIRLTNHGNALSCYFRDPENNHMEVYWSTGMDYPQPHGESYDLDLSNKELLMVLENMAPKEGSMPRFYGKDVGKRLPATAAVAR